MPVPAEDKLSAPTIPFDDSVDLVYIHGHQPDAVSALTAERDTHFKDTAR